MSASSPFAMYVQFAARAGQQEALVELLLEAAELVAALPDCATYVVATVPGDDTTVCVMEAWTSAEAHSASLEREDVRAIVGRGMPLIAAVATQVQMVPAHPVGA